MIETSSISVLVQGGAVGLCVLLIWVVYKLVSNHDEHLQAVVQRNTDAWVDNTRALQRLSDKLEK